jgi:hypothetical protein
VTRVASFENTDSIGKALSRNWWQLMWPVPSRTTNQEVAGLQSFLFKDGTDLLKEAQIERFHLEERGVEARRRQLSATGSVAVGQYPATGSGQV